MSLGWSAIVVLVLLLPGFMFLSGMLFPERVSRDTTPRSPVSRLAGIVLVSAVVHAALITAGNLLRGCWSLLPAIDEALILTALDFGEPSAEAVTALAATFDRYFFHIAGYVLVSAVLGFLLGWAAVVLALRLRQGRRGFSVLLEHDWIYDVFPARMGQLTPTIAYILTTSREQGCALMYKGTVHRCGLAQDGRFSYFVLRKPERFHMSMGAGGAVPGVPAAIAEKDGDDDPDFLVLDGSQVANVYFQRFSARSSPDDSAVVAAAKGTIGELKDAAARRDEASVAQPPGGPAAVAPAADPPASLPTPGTPPPPEAPPPVSAA